MQPGRSRGHAPPDQPKSKGTACPVFGGTFCGLWEGGVTVRKRDGIQDHGVGSVRLTSIARSLNEAIALHATNKRLDDRLADPGVGEVVNANLLRMGAEAIGEESLPIVDQSDVWKNYAARMEYLVEVRDGGNKEIGMGCWLCAVVGCTVDGAGIAPLSQKLRSQKAPDFVSENEMILGQVAEVLAATGYRGTIVYDRGRPLSGVQGAIEERDGVGGVLRHAVSRDGDPREE